MRILGAILDFMYGNGPSGAMIDVLGVQPDPELVERNKARTRQATEYLGDRWVLARKQPRVDTVVAGYPGLLTTPTIGAHGRRD